MSETCILAYDMGSTGVQTCLFRIGETIDTNKRALKIEEKEAERKTALVEQE